jgi:hypothetical protein
MPISRTGYLPDLGSTVFGLQAVLALGPVSVSAAMPHSGSAFWVVAGFWSDGTVLLPVVTVELPRAVGSGPAAPLPWALAETVAPKVATTKREKPIFSFICDSSASHKTVG